MNISVRYKTLLLILMTIVIALGGYALLLRNVTMMETYSTTQTQALVERKIAAETEKINTYMNVTQDAAASIATAGESLLRVSRNTNIHIEAETKDYLTHTLARYPKAVGCGLWYEPDEFITDTHLFGPYVLWKNNQIQLTMEYNTPEYDYVHKPWYTQALPADWNRKTPRPERVYWSAPYLDDTTNTLLITVSGIMYGDDGRIVGISSLGVSIENLRKSVDELRITPGSIPFAIDTRSGLVAAYPADNSLLLAPASKLPFTDSQKVISSTGPGTSRQFSTTIKDEPCTVFYSVSATGMGLGIAVPNRELFAETNALSQANTRTTLYAVGALLLLVGIIFVLLNRIIIKPILSLSAYSQSVAQGDFDTPVSDAYQSEFAVLRNAMVSMVATLKAKMHEADRRTDEARISAQNAEQAQHAAEEATHKAECARTEGMRHAAQRLSLVVNALTDALGSLSARVDETAGGVQTQTLRIAETASAVEELSASVLEIAKNAENTANLSEESRHAAEQGSQQFATVLHDVSAIHRDFQTACDSVDDLSNKANAIGAIAQTIEDIADQTNLLALNAAIEAARAGEAGRGFAVVADEVRKLAEKTMTATREVGQSIDAIQQAVHGTLGNMSSTKDVLEKSVNEVNKAEGLLGSIVNLAMESSDQVRAIATASEQQSAATGEINASVTAVSSIAEGTASAMQEAANAVEALKHQSSALTELIAELDKA